MSLTALAEDFSAPGKERIVIPFEDDFLVVGRTNRAALEMGARTGNTRILHMETRTEAVRWVRNTLVAGDAVLYENDLPDHYF